MTSRDLANGIIRAVITLTLVALLLYLVYQITTVIVYIVISLIFTLIANPIVSFLKKRLKFKNTLAVSTTLILFMLLFLGIGALFVPLFITQSANLSLLNTQAIEQNLILIASKLQSLLSSYGVDMNTYLQPKEWISRIDFNWFTGFFNSVVSFVSNFGMGLFSVFFISFFFMKDRNKFMNSFRTLIPNSHKEKIINSIEKIDGLLSRYFIGLLSQLFIVFILYFIVLLLFGIQNALIIAFLCSILCIIPYIGPIIGAVFAAILSMLSNINGDFNDMMLTTLYVLIGFSIVQIIDNNISQPLIFSNSVKSHPLEIFLIILIAGFLTGITGIIVAIPVYTILKVVGKEFFPNNKFIQLLTKDI